MSIRHESHLVLDRLRLLREMNRRGLSGATFASEAGITPGTLSGVMHGKAISVRTAQKIATALVRLEPVEGLDAILADQEPGEAA